MVTQTATGLGPTTRERGGETGQIDLYLTMLVDTALSSSDLRDVRREETQLAAGAVRDALRGLESTQEELTVALVASQDRIQAMKTLARVNVQGVASDHTIELLLKKSLKLAGCSLVVLFNGSQVSATMGQTQHLAERCAIALQSIEDSPHDLLRTADRDHAIVCTVDPDGSEQRYLAFFRDDDRRFSTVDLPIIEAIVSSLGLMLAFNEFHQRELHQVHVEREHQLASQLAQSAISERTPQSSRVDIFARTIPASITGGDFYAFGETEGRIWFAVGDVTGKGLPAAIVMTRAVTACRVAFLAGRDSSVLDVFARIEDDLFDHLDEVGVFVTLVIGMYDEADGTITLANAGHSPVVTVGGETAEFVPASAPPLGVARGRIPQVATVALRPGCALVIGSDGLTEQSNRLGDMYGYEPFLELCESAIGGTAGAVGTIILESVDRFGQGCAASDDMTLVVLLGTES